MGHGITTYPEYKKVPISRDWNVADGEQVYIGNGQGCATLWFVTVEEARAFIDKYEKRIKITNYQRVKGLIPNKICLKCKGHYSYNTKAWKNAPRTNCSDIKQQLKSKVET